MRAKDIMTTNVATIRPSATVADAVRLMRLKELRSLIVEPHSQDDAYGIVTESDIAGKVVACGADPKEVKVYEIMSKPCIVVNPDLAIEYVARLFVNTGVWRAPVIQGELLGVISVSDIIAKGDFVDTPKITSLQKELEKAISSARAISTKYTAHSEQANEAWDLVDELETEACYYGLPKPEKTAREQFSDEQMAQMRDKMTIGC